MKTKKIAHKIYETTVNGEVYSIDGQNHEFDSKEWQLFVTGEKAQFGYEWIDTFPTKREAVKFLEEMDNA